jgi:hypothetical protein
LRSNRTKNSGMSYFYYSLKGWIFLVSQVMYRNHNSVGSEKIQVRVLDEVAIYTCIDNPHGVNEHTIVENVLEFNPAKELCERHGFTQFNGGFKP